MASKCGVGWKPIVVGLLTALDAEIAKQPASERASFRVVTIKQKLGALRVYMASWTEVMQAAIDAAEAASLRTCEVCSRPGKRRVCQGLWMTRCRTHRRRKRVP